MNVNMSNAKDDVVFYDQNLIMGDNNKGICVSKNKTILDNNQDYKQAPKHQVQA